MIEDRLLLGVRVAFLMKSHMLVSAPCCSQLFYGARFLSVNWSVSTKNCQARNREPVATLFCQHGTILGVQSTSMGRKLGPQCAKIN